MNQIQRTPNPSARPSLWARARGVLWRAYARLFVRLGLLPPPPPIVFTDTDGVGWTRHPDSEVGRTPDEGQHDLWKGLMRDWLAHDETTLLGTDLSAACRRLGFRELALAAEPGISSSSLRVVYDAHEALAQAEAQARFDRCAQNKSAGLLPSWMVVDPVETTLSTLTAGPFERGPDDLRPALKPL